MGGGRHGGGVLRLDSVRHADEGTTSLAPSCSSVSVHRAQRKGVELRSVRSERSESSVRSERSERVSPFLESSGGSELNLWAWRSEMSRSLFVACEILYP